MGGLNEADRLKKDGGLDAKKASVTKLPLGQLRVATDGPIAHPRAHLPADEALVLWIMANGMRSREGTPWRLLAREQGIGDGGSLDVVVGNGSRRHKAGTEAERRLRETAPRALPLVWDKADPNDLGRLYVEIELHDGTDAEFLLARLAANSEPGKLPDSAEVLAETVRQLAACECEDVESIVAVMPRGVGRKEVQALARWKLLTKAARARFVEGDLPPAVLSAVLDAPPAEQLGVVEAFIAGNVRTAMKATIRTKKAREEKTGEPATKGVGWKPKKLVAVARSINLVSPYALRFIEGGVVAREGHAPSVEEAEAAVKMIEDAAEARGFAKAMLFQAGEKTGRLSKTITTALKAADQRGGKKS